MITERQQNILRLIIQNYTNTGLPVGSKKLMEDGIASSSATIRNDMKALEAVSYTHLDVYKRQALPAEYRQVFQEIEKYAWHFSDHSGANMFNALTDLLDLFEEGAANGTPIKNITGEKVGDFAETIVNEVAGKWTDKQKEKLNHQFSKQ